MREPLEAEGVGRRPSVNLRSLQRTFANTGAGDSPSSLSDVTATDCRLDLVGLRIAKLERVAFVTAG
ncbi:MAG: hypothetical protein QOE43_1464 [Gaiellaceae bacterium]|jgi:hypothetical protein|nr:hypothetical protein [Gaiellaceae bacterium]